MVQKRTVTDWLKAGKIRGFKLGESQSALWRISESDLELFLNSQANIPKWQVSPDLCDSLEQYLEYSPFSKRKDADEACIVAMLEKRLPMFDFYKETLIPLLLAVNVTDNIDRYLMRDVYHEIHCKLGGSGTKENYKEVAGFIESKLLSKNYSVYKNRLTYESIDNLYYYLNQHYLVFFKLEEEIKKRVKNRKVQIDLDDI